MFLATQHITQETNAEEGADNAGADIVRTLSGSDISAIARQASLEVERIALANDTSSK